MVDFLQGLYTHGVFSRGLPTRPDLNTDKYATSLRQVLDARGRVVVVTKQPQDPQPQDPQARDPLRQCLEKGWLFSESNGKEEIKYRFASPLHERYVEWLLLEKEGLIRAPNITKFVIKVLKLFSPKNLKPREDLKSSGSPPQSIPEAQFQHEFYRACYEYTKGLVLTFPECGTAKGRIDFFIRSKKWGIELLRNGDKLAAHDDRFTQGEYGKWIEEGMMDDYIMIDFRSNIPTDETGKRIRIITTRKTIIYEDCRFQMFICCFDR